MCLPASSAARTAPVSSTSAEKRVQQRRLARSRLSQHDGDHALGHKRPDGVLSPGDAKLVGGPADARRLVAPGSRGRERQVASLAKDLPHGSDIPRKDGVARPVRLGQHHGDVRPAVPCNDGAAGDALAGHLALSELLNHKHHVNVGGKGLLLSAGLSAPARYVALARQNLLDEAHLVALGQAGAHPVAHGHPGVLLAGKPALGEPCGKLRPKGLPLAAHGGVPAVKADDAAHHKLVGILASLPGSRPGSQKRLALPLAGRELPKRRKLRQRGKSRQDPLLDPTGSPASRLPTTLARTLSHSSSISCYWSFSTARMMAL